MHALLNKIRNEIAFQLIRAAERVLPRTSQLRQVFRQGLSQFEDWERYNAWGRFAGRTPLTFEQWRRISSPGNSEAA